MPDDQNIPKIPKGFEKVFSQSFEKKLPPGSQSPFVRGMGQFGPTMEIDKKRMKEIFPDWKDVNEEFMDSMLPGRGDTGRGDTKSGGQDKFPEGIPSFFKNWHNKKARGSDSNVMGGGVGQQKAKDIKFDTVTISSLEIEEVTIQNLTIDSIDGADKEDDFDITDKEKELGWTPELKKEYNEQRKFDEENHPPNSFFPPILENVSDVESNDSFNPQDWVGKYVDDVLEKELEWLETLPVELRNLDEETLTSDLPVESIDSFNPQNWVGKSVDDVLEGEKMWLETLPVESNKLGEETLTSIPKEEEKVLDYSMVGMDGMDALSAPIQDMEGSNAEMSDVLQGKGAFGGGFSEVSANTNDMTGSLEDISSILGEEDPYAFSYKDEAGEGFFGGIINGMVEAAQLAWTVISDVAKGVWTVISDVAKGAWTVISDTVSALWTGVTDIVTGLWTGVTDIVTGLWTGVKDIASGIWTGVKDVASGIWTGVKDVASGIWEGVKDVASGIWEGITSTVAGLWEGVTSTVSGAFTKVTDTIGTAISSTFEGAKEVAGGIWEGVGDIVGFDTASDTEAHARAAGMGNLGARVRNISGDVIAIRDISFNIYDCLIEIKGMISNMDTTFIPESTLPPTEELAIVSPTTIIDEKFIDIPKEDTEKNEILSNQENEHKEFSNIVKESSNLRTLNDSRNMGMAGTNEQRKPLRPSSGNNPKNMIDPKNSSMARGMDPSYTKQPPPPIPNSQKMINEIQSYAMYPRWRTKLG